MPYIYFSVLLVFLVLYSVFITFQVYKLISLELSFKKIVLKKIDSNNMDQLFNTLRILLYKRLWLKAIKLLEYPKNVPQISIHKYFNAVGFVYYSMEKYDLAKLYYLRSLSKKDDYLAVLNNLAKVYEKKKGIF